MLQVLTVVYLTALLSASIISSKVIQFGVLTLPAGIIVFPITYITGDLIAECFGFKIARRTVLMGVMASAAMATLFYVAAVLPPAAFWKQQEAYASVLTQVPRIVLAGLVSITAGELLNAWVLLRLKTVWNGERFPLRAMLSSVCGQGVDSLVFNTVAFSGLVGPSGLIRLILSGLAIKLAYESVCLPITTVLARRLKKNSSLAAE